MKKNIQGVLFVRSEVGHLGYTRPVRGTQGRRSLVPPPTRNDSVARRTDLRLGHTGSESSGPRTGEDTCDPGPSRGFQHNPWTDHSGQWYQNSGKKREQTLKTKRWHAPRSEHRHFSESPYPSLRHTWRHSPCVGRLETGRDGL